VSWRSDATDAFPSTIRGALDLNVPRLIRLSPNWAASIPLPGEPAFLTLTEVRYVRIPNRNKTASYSYMERWDASFHKIRYGTDCGRDLLWRVVISAEDDTRCDFSLKFFSG
jgi:hypothetical protein